MCAQGIICGHQHVPEKGRSLRFTRIFPAVALAVTSSSLIPAFADAASSPIATPHSRVSPSQATPAAVTGKRGPSSEPTGVGRAADAGTTVPSRGAVRQAARLLLATINSVRTARGLLPLTLDRRESRCSRLHSQHMALTGQLSHDQFPTDVCVPHRVAGENVGYDAGAPTSAVLAIQQYMMSEGPCHSRRCSGTTYEQHGHYLNLINPSYRHVGIGIVVKHGTTWLTEDFTS